MPFNAHMIGIKWSLGTYSVSSQFSGRIDEKRLRESGRLSDVAEPGSGYRDFAAIFFRDHFSEFTHPGSPASKWFDGLPREVHFIFVHLEEWESGLGP